MDEIWEETAAPVVLVEVDWKGVVGESTKKTDLRQVAVPEISSLGLSRIQRLRQKRVTAAALGLWIRL